MQTKTLCVLAWLVSSAGALPARAHASETEAPKGGPGTVTLPLALFDALSERAARQPRPPVAAPLDAVLVHSEIRARVAGALVRGTLRVEGEVLRSGPTRVNLFTRQALDGTPLLDARAAGHASPALLLSAEGLDALVSGPASFALELEWAVPVSSTPGRTALTLPVPRAGSVHASLDLPGDPAELALDVGTLTRRRTLDGRTLVDATLDAGRLAHVTWSARDTAPAVAPRAAVFLGDVKTVLTLGEAELGMAALVDVTVVEGRLEQLELELPAGYELSSLSGPSLDSSAERPGGVTLSLRESESKRHQFVLGLARSVDGASYEIDVPLLRLPAARRETGELAVVGLGTLELRATESGTLRRLDPSEASPALRTLAREPLLAAFRYHRRAAEGPSLALGVQRFEAAPVLAALAEQGRATTLVTREGRALTELRLTVRNQAQPFLRVSLPAGATLLSADVAGESVKPVQGDGGTRVPLLRRGFRPDGPYEVSFVYVQPGEAFGKRGSAQLALPPIDLPITRLDWELFLPERYEVRRFEGDLQLYSAAWDGAAASAAAGFEFSVEGGVVGGVPGGVVGGVLGGAFDAEPGEPAAPPVASGITGRVTDTLGTALPGVSVTLADTATSASRAAVSDERGVYAFAAVPAGRYEVRAELRGFAPARRRVNYRGGRFVAHLRLEVGALAESVELAADATRSDEWQARQRDEPQQQAPSANVLNLQRRVAGLLPVHVEVPRSGVAFHLLRTLVFDEPSQVTFRYRAR